ncbi:MAG: two-component system, NarL family, response regulator DegU [Clostridia bacterium]|nr:two-component system, NarL family, response regulator DegU [Clostridia bacterium]
MSWPIRVLIADDHPLVREGIRKILGLEPRISIVGEATDGQEAVELAKSCRPDIVLMDINMPRINGIEATKAIKKSLPDTSIIALTIHDDDEYIMELLRAGISGYVLKDIGTEALLNTVLQVAEGLPVIHPGIAKKMLGLLQNKHSPDPGNRNPLLTSREKEVLLHVVKGKSNREIAKELYISEKTVKNHLTNIFRKLGVHDRTQAALYALKHGLTDAKLD